MSAAVEDRKVGELIEVDAEECPIETTSHCLDLNLESPVSIVVSKFTDKYYIIITETGKTGILYEVRRDRAATNITTGEPRHVYETSLLLGSETEETTVVARLIAEQVNTDHSIVLGLGFRDYTKGLNPTNVRKLVDFIKSIIV
jgi:hypothetical protein